MHALLRSGGLLAFSCAGPGRPEHGTQQRPDLEPGFDGLWGTSPDYYRPLAVEDVATVFDLRREFERGWKLEIEPKHRDLYFCGLKN